MSPGLSNGLSVGRDLASLTSRDEAAAREAFDRLWGLVVAPARRQALRQGTRREEADDIVQNVAAKLWRLRAGLRAASPGEWMALVRTAVRRELANRWGAGHPEARLDEGHEIPDGEMPYLDAAVEAAEDRRRIYEAADRLWLGETPSSDAELGAIGVQHALLDEMDQAEIAMVLGVSPSDVERWLADPAIVARALFSALCWSGDELASYVLRPERPLDPEELNALSGRPTGAREATDWDETDVSIVLWALREGMNAREIAAAMDDVEEAHIRAVLDRLRERYPFRAIARILHAELETRGRAGELASPGLWKRIAVEYHAREGLPRRQIVDRAGPPAAEASFHLDEPLLNNWLSMGRLYAQLAASLAKERA